MVGEVGELTPSKMDVFALKYIIPALFALAAISGIATSTKLEEVRERSERNQRILLKMLDATNNLGGMTDDERESYRNELIDGGKEAESVK